MSLVNMAIWAFVYVSLAIHAYPALWMITFRVPEFAQYFRCRPFSAFLLTCMFFLLLLDAFYLRVLGQLVDLRYDDLVIYTLVNALEALAAIGVWWAIKVQVDPKGPKPPNMAGKTILVTGSTSAVGRAAVRRLAKAGATVIMSGPEVEKGNTLTDGINESKIYKGKVEFMELDLGSLSSVQRFVKELAEKHPEGIHALINNAHRLTTNKDKRTEQGFEPSFGITFLGHFYLTKLLLPLLYRTAVPAGTVGKDGKKSAGWTPRIINVSSAAHQYSGKDQFHSFFGESKRTPYGNYALSTFCTAAFTKELARRLEKGGVVFLQNPVPAKSSASSSSSSSSSLSSPAYSLRARKNNSSSSSSSNSKSSSSDLNSKKKSSSSSSSSSPSPSSSPSSAGLLTAAGQEYEGGRVAVFAVHPGSVFSKFWRWPLPPKSLTPLVVNRYLLRLFENYAFMVMRSCWRGASDLVYLATNAPEPLDDEEEEEGGGGSGGSRSDKEKKEKERSVLDHHGEFFVNCAPWNHWHPDLLDEKFTATVWDTAEALLDQVGFGNN